MKLRLPVEGKKHDLILINKDTKRSSHMTPRTINDRPLVKHIMLIGISSAEFLL